MAHRSFGTSGVLSQKGYGGVVRVLWVLHSLTGITRCGVAQIALTKTSHIS